MVNNNLQNVGNMISDDMDIISDTLKYSENQVFSFLRKLSDNRILDLYLKYMGISVLSPAALVPFGLILGKDFFEYAVKKMTQSGGYLPKFVPRIPNDIPAVDDELFGNTLKLLGLGTLSSIAPTTLIPLGLAMYIYDNFVMEKSLIGGRVTMPMQYYNDGYVGNYSSNVPSFSKGWPANPPSRQTGGNYFSSSSNYGPYVDLQLDSTLPPVSVLENQLYDGQMAGPYVAAATGGDGVSPTPTQTGAGKHYKSKRVRFGRRGMNHGMGHKMNHGAHCN